MRAKVVRPAFEQLQQERSGEPEGKTEVKTNDPFHKLAKLWLDGLLDMKGAQVQERRETILAMCIEQLVEAVERHGPDWPASFALKPSEET